ncbi:hypothetical protein R6231_07095 [Bacillus cytotoxicus]|uniref:Uncharacterized protein n=1 Tax=Bacillus cytotoxicus TaxID=580165 RepID=A0AAX2CGX1_9BACI|nr:hypothetical protein [Bacillus cytotoxicus]MDH2875675.1 hypothetical protein [Bacillus cytotoxicus]MDH2891616.1 hypothetical protein [Bacillus cytotoxicus]MDH2921358.1 hypothetical protein [Bacillus cytotoxicus]SCL91734.1 Uncharacterized protein BCB44BAC_01926 [Bacillus cytotoxicus]SCN35813.1 Uncharacterized protein BC88300_01965 [Bacillus cytotoxicus]
MSEEPYEADWTKELEKEFVKVKTDCYGSIKTKERIFEKEKWENYKEQGYFME